MQDGTGRKEGVPHKHPEQVTTEPPCVTGMKGKALNGTVAGATPAPRAEQEVGASAGPRSGGTGRLFRQGFLTARDPASYWQATAARTEARWETYLTP